MRKRHLNLAQNAFYNYVLHGVSKKESVREFEENEKLLEASAEMFSRSLIN